MRSRWFAAICGGVIVLVMLAVVLAPFIAPYGQTALAGDPWEKWTLAHPLGTDNLGRDMLTRLLFGTRNTVLVAFGATLLAFVVGVTLAFMAAVFSGWVDEAPGSSPGSCYRPGAAHGLQAQGRFHPKSYN